MTNTDKSTRNLDDSKFVILFIEDNEHMYPYWIDCIQRTWSPQSQHARSLGRAKQLLETGFVPDLVLHSCNILFKDEETHPSTDAGDILYELFVERGLPVIMVTGSEEHCEEEPYISHRPLAILSKPLARQLLDDTVTNYRNSQSPG